MDEQNIGRLARFMGIPAHTIKYYEKVGLLHSERDAQSNYRRYHMRICTAIVQCLRYRGMGFSLKEIGELTKSAGDRDHETMVESRLTIVKQELEKLEELRDFLEDYQEECREAEREEGRWYVMPFHDVIYCRLQTRNLTFTENNLADDEINMIDYMPRTGSLSVLSRNYMEGGAQEYSWGRSMVFKERQPLFENRPEFICLAPKRAFVAYRKYTGHFLSDGEMAEDIRRLFHEFAPEFPADVYALEIKITHDEEGRDWNYFKIVVPLD